jgi:hypothetical protein
MVPKAIFAVAFLIAMLPNQMSALLADNKLTFSSFGGVGPHEGDAPREKWPWLYSSVIAYDFETGRPIAWFGACKEKDQQGRYLYLLLFKTPEDFPKNEKSKINPSIGSDCRATNTFHHCKISAEFAKQKVDIDYKIDLDEQTGAIGKEILKLGGKEIKEGEPRVFVVDLTKDEVTYLPIKVAFPTDVPDGTDKDHENWEAPLRRSIEQLTKKSPEVKKLLER